MEFRILFKAHISGYKFFPMKWLITPSALLLFLLSVSLAGAAEVRAMTSNALAESFREILPEFERTTQIKVLSAFGGDDIPKRLEDGEPADVLIIWQRHLETLVK